MASYPHTWAKLATIATRLSELVAEANGSARELKSVSEGRKFVERIVGEHAASKGLYRRLRCLVYNNRKGWNRVSSERVEFQAYSAHAWYLLVLYELALISDAGVRTLLSQPTKRVHIDELEEEYRKILGVVRDAYESRFGGAANSALWKAIEIGAYDLHDKCQSVAIAQRNKPRQQAKPQHRAVQTNADETAIDWIHQHRHIHELDGMLFLYERRDEIHCELDDIIRAGDIEKLVPVYHEFNRIAWALEWSDLHERYQEAIIDAAEDASLAKRYPLQRVNAIIQGRGVSGALRALLDGKGLDFVMETPKAMTDAVDEWDMLLTAAEKDAKSAIERRMYLESLASTSRARGLLAAPEDFELARSHFENGMRIAMQAGTESQWLAFAREYACLLRKNKRSPQAVQLLRNGIEVAEQRGNDRRAMQLILEAAELCIDQGQPDGARLLYTQAEATFNRIQGLNGEPWYQPTWRLELARVEKRLEGLNENENENGNSSDRTS